MGVVGLPPPIDSWTESLVLVEKMFWCLLQGKEKEKERETRDV
jgi:hypothetical protein